MRFAIFGNEYQPEKSAMMQRVLDFLVRNKVEIFVDRPFYEFLLRQAASENVSETTVQQLKRLGVFDDDNFQTDYAVSMGGDGTFLKAASRVGTKGIPIIGVNMGRLGFLADVLPGEIEEAFETLMRGEAAIEEHAVIECMVEEQDGQLRQASTFPYALNDIAVLKRDTASMITIRTSVDGEFLVTYQADGLIVSTPTGSTAYNLSNGGPIMVPKSGILCLTPVAPHSLNIRPIVIHDDCEIELEVESRSHNFLVAIDGRSEKVEQGTRLMIRRAPHTVKVVKRPAQRYFSTLRGKMMWGADKR